MRKANIELFLKCGNEDDKASVGISERETEILKLAAEGFSNKQIAAQLHITSATVDTHNRSIVKKLKARNMKQAIAIGVRTKIVE